MLNIWIRKMTVAGKHLNRVHRPRLTLLGEYSLRIDGDRVSVAPHMQRSTSRCCQASLRVWTPKGSVNVEDDA